MVLACLSFYFLFFITTYSIFLFVCIFFRHVHFFSRARIVFWLGIVNGKENKGGGGGGRGGRCRSLQLGNEDVMLLFVVVAVAFLSI